MFFGFFISLKKITREFFNFKINIIFFKYLLFTNILLCPNETVKKKSKEEETRSHVYTKFEAFRSSTALLPGACECERERKKIKKRTN